MELILANIDLILSALIILIAAVIFARRGQVELLRELILSLSDSTAPAELYNRLPTLTKLLVSSKALSKIADEARG